MYLFPERANLPCSVVVPRGTPKVKCEAIQGYGAELVFCDPTPTSRFEFFYCDLFEQPR